MPFQTDRSDISDRSSPRRAPGEIAAEGRDPFLDCISHLEDHIEDAIEASFKAPAEKMPVTLPPNCAVPVVSVTADASVRFGCDAVTPPPRTAVSFGAFRRGRYLEA